MTEEIKNEIILNEVIRTSNEKKMTTDKHSFANALKNGLGDEIKNELMNPPKPDKNAGKRLKRRRFWGKLKEDFKLMFFTSNKKEKFDDYGE
jgi:hypothetical protein